MTTPPPAETPPVFPDVSEGDPSAPVDMGAASVRRRALSGVVAIGVRGLVIRALGFLSNIALARLLTPSDFGVLAFGQAFIAFAALLGDVGIGASLVRREVPPTRRELQAVFAFQLAVIVPVTALTCAVALATQTRAGLVTAVIVLSMPVALLRTPTTIRLEREVRFGQMAVAEVLETLSYIAWAVTSVALGAGVWGVATAIIVKVAVGSTFLVARDRERVLRPRFELAVVRGLLAFGVRIQAANAVFTIRGQGINVLTASVAGLSTLGYWSLSERIMQLPLILFEALARVTFPAMSRLIDAGEDPVPEVERTMRLGAVIACLLLVGVSASAPLGVPAVFGETWDATGPVIPVVAFGVALLGPVVTGVNGYFFARGDAHFYLRAVSASYLGWLCIGLPLLPSLGVLANAYGLTAAATIEASVLTYYAHRFTSVRVVGNIVPTVAVGAVAVAAGLWWSRDFAPTVPAAILVAVAATAVWLLLMLVLRRDDLTDAMRLGRRFLPRPS